MGCRINYRTREGMLCAVVSGKSTERNAAWIARSIAGQAGAQTANRVLIDLRRLADRVGRLGTLSLANGDAGAVGGYRVAVVDVADNDPYYVFCELSAKARGLALRCFSDTREALQWLRRAAD